MKEIVASTSGDAKLRLRGRGSNYMERDTKEESPEALQLCISCPRAETYNLAVRLTEDLMRGIYDEYNRWCAERGKAERAPEIRMSERHHTEAGGDSGGGAGGGGGGGGSCSGGGGGGGRAIADAGAGEKKPRRRGGRNRKRKSAIADADAAAGAAPLLPRTEAVSAGAGQDEDAGDADSGNGDSESDGDQGSGVAPEGAPTAQEIEQFIEMRNQARKKSNFAEADRIRDTLKDRGVVLSDEKGGHGSAKMVTSWRYWRE